MQTNSFIPWAFTTDKAVMDTLLEMLEGSRFGRVDMTRLYATGISSGGYMLSRMAHRLGSSRTEARAHAVPEGGSITWRRG